MARRVASSIEATTAGALLRPGRRDWRDGERNRQDRQSVGEDRGSRGSRGNVNNGDIKTQIMRQLTQPVRIIERDEAASASATELPGTQRQFAANPGGITHGEGKREHASHNPVPSLSLRGAKRRSNPAPARHRIAASLRSAQCWVVCIFVSVTR